MNFDVELWWEAVTSRDFLMGAITAVTLAILAQACAVILGFCVALARRSPSRILRVVGGFYVWLFRATPTLLVLLLVWNAGPQLLPALREDWFNPYLAALIGLSIVEAAYMAEIIRGALLSVDPGQTLAARALGMTPAQVMWKVVIPQATRIAIPPTGNELIGQIKFTSLASVISLKELLSTAQVAVSITYRYAEYYAAALVYYLVIVSILTLVQHYVERRFLWVTKGLPSEGKALLEESEESHG